MGDRYEQVEHQAERDTIVAVDDQHAGDSSEPTEQLLSPAEPATPYGNGFSEKELNEKQQQRRVRLLPVRKSNWKRPPTLAIIVFFAVLFLVGYLFSYALVSLTRYGHAQKRINVILMISDGFGPASETFARNYIQYLHQTNHTSVQPGNRWSFEAGFAGKDGIGQGGFGTLPLDRLLVGQSRTRSSNSLVTDSAAGATAFSCGKKTYNGGIAVDPLDREPLGTILEAAKHSGWLTGLAVTSRITHATPASFYAHVVDRDMESEIAAMLLPLHPLSGQQVDLAFGGGRCFFLPNTSDGSCRKDARDILEETAKIGKTRTRLISDRSEFDYLAEDASALGTIGLFNLDHLNYEIDRSTTEEPSLLNMTSRLLRTLSNAATDKNAHGFFAMIEGSRIDMAGHSNDPIAHMYDILAYQETVRFAKNFADEQTANGWPTLLVSVSDHETGGLSLAKQLDLNVYPEYLWFPQALVNATASTFVVATDLIARAPLSENSVRDAIENRLGIDDLNESEVRSIQDEANLWELDKILSKIVSDRAQLGWSTHGHSGVDVSLYAYGYRSSELKGNVENSEIGLFLADVMQLDLNATTNMLRRNSRAWHSTDTPDTIDTIGIQHYHGADAHSHGGNSHLYLPDDS